MSSVLKKGKAKIFAGGLRTKKKKKTKKDRRGDRDDDDDGQNAVPFKRGGDRKTKDGSGSDLDSTQVSSELEAEPRSRGGGRKSHGGSNCYGYEPPSPKLPKGRKSISSADLKELLTNREECSRRLNYLEEEVARKEREAEKLRWQRQEQERRIRELEAMNALLHKEARCRTLTHSPVDYRDGSGQSSRSKASLMEDEERRRQRRQEEEEELQAAISDNDRETWSVSDVGSDDEDLYYDNDDAPPPPPPEKPSSEKNLVSNSFDSDRGARNCRDIRRSKSDNGDIRQVCRSKSPSSTRGFGKQSGGTATGGGGGRGKSRRDVVRASREKRERSRRTSGAARPSRSSINKKRGNPRSKSPRSYLHRKD